MENDCDISSESSSDKEPKMAQEPPKKKTRKSYSYLHKAEILEKYFRELAQYKHLHLSDVGNEVGINKSMLLRWIQDKDDIFLKASQDKICHLKKGRGSTKHQKTFPRLYTEFMKMRERGQKVSFLWFWIKGKKIAKEIEAPMFTRSAAHC